MKRLTCTLAALAMVMLRNIPAQAQSLKFLGTLQRDQPWTLEINNGDNSAAAGVTIFYLGKTLDFDIFTVPAADGVTLDISKMPRGTTRVIIEVSAPSEFCPCSVPVRIIQGGTALANPAVEGARLAIDFN
jgi:hypothetical protein